MRLAVLARDPLMAVRVKVQRFLCRYLSDLLMRKGTICFLLVPLPCLMMLTLIMSSWSLELLELWEDPNVFSKSVVLVQKRFCMKQDEQHDVPEGQLEEGPHRNGHSTP